MCVWHAESQLVACFILFGFFIFIDSNIPHKRLSALNFSVRDIRFARTKKHQLGDVAKLWYTHKKKYMNVYMSVGNNATCRYLPDLLGSVVP